MALWLAEEVVDNKVSNLEVNVSNAVDDKGG